MDGEGLSGSQLFVRQFGRGDPLVLVHGLMVTGEMFEPVLDALAKGHKLIVPDLRGHGRSAHLPGPYTTERLADDLAELLDTLEIESADVLGYSQGGAVAQQFARRYPHLTRRLILACTYAYNGLSRRERIENTALLWLVRSLGTGAIARIAIRPGIGGGRPLSPERARWLRSSMASNDRGRMVEAVRAMVDFDSREWLGQISSPTLVLCGSEDSAVPMAHSEMLAGGIKVAQLRVVEDAGHALIWTHPEELVEQTEQWLSSEPRQR